ncbi:uncharacterized protein LOC119724267 [Patiria miniata]|uniref:Uncharacterized protein n=1 Tax=Patiria miniata TaxID=46514 RepID=A0A913ZIG1_PATMI|nr:uncharacterized protein LOC119724267 [Patiria miniata]
MVRVIPMKLYPLLAVAVLFVAGPFRIIEAYSPFGGYHRALLGNVWVRASDNRARPASTPEEEANEQRMTGAKRPAGSPVFHSALTYGKRADEADTDAAVERRAFHSALPFGKRTAMDRRGLHSALPFGKRDDEEAEQDALMERRGFNSALMFGKRIHTALPFGKRGYHSALPFGKRSDEEEGTAMERRGYHTGLPFGKRDDGTDAAVSEILSQLRSED